MSINELKTNLFDKAMRWYQSGDSGKKEAALDLFPEDMLKKELDAYKKRDSEERERAREEELHNVLRECEKIFPVGMLVWSDDGSDKCANLIVSKPFIAQNDYHVPFEKYNYDDKFPRKTVLAKVVRIQYFGNDEIPGGWGHSVVGLEKLLINMGKTDSSYVNTKPIINLKDFYLEKQSERQEEISKLTDRLDSLQKDVDKTQKELSELEGYNPYDLTEEKIQEIVKRYA